MKEYQIDYIYTEFIEAETEEKARNKAYDLINERKIDLNAKCDIEVFSR